MALLSEGSSVKENPEDKQVSAPCVRGSAKIPRWVTPASNAGGLQVFQLLLRIIPGWSGNPT